MSYEDLTPGGRYGMPESPLGPTETADDSTALLESSGGDNAANDDEASSLPRPRERHRPRRPRRMPAPSRKRKHAGFAKKYHLLTHLLASLDSLIFIELAVLYYNEYVVKSNLPVLGSFSPYSGEQGQRKHQQKQRSVDD